jgi:hypothetical protein
VDEEPAVQSPLLAAEVGYDIDDDNLDADHDDNLDADLDNCDIPPLRKDA